MSDLNPLLETIAEMRQQFTSLLRRHVGESGVTVDAYHRYLSMQYHLTKGVQRYFFIAAAHSDLSRMRRLRRFLVDFGNEEELHYMVAAKDIQALGRQVLPEPFDVHLWHAYFSREVVERPFIRLGAACLLENLSHADNRPYLAQLLKAPFLSSSNTKFLVLHMHESLPHGEQILHALAGEDLSDSQLMQLDEGIRKGAVLYLRMVEWALDLHALAHVADEANTAMAEEEQQAISHFDVAELGL